MIKTINAPLNVHVFPIISPRSGEAVRNQYSILIPGKVCFQSYESLIAVYDYESGQLILGRHFDYSVTTSKYLNAWLQNHCYNLYCLFPKGKSIKDTLTKAINAGLIEYDENMI